MSRSSLRSSGSPLGRLPGFLKSFEYSSQSCSLIFQDDGAGLRPFIKFILFLLCMSSGMVCANPQEDPISLKPHEIRSDLAEEPSSVEDEEDLESETSVSIEAEESSAPTGEDLNFWGENKDRDSSFWEGTPRKILDQFLPQLSLSSTPPALIPLLNELMLRGGFPKEGGSIPGSLSQKRAEMLMNLNHGEDAFKVLQEDIISETLTPEAKNSYEQLQFLSLLSAHDNDQACTLGNSKGYGAADAFWLKAKIICQTLQGESEKARVHLEALQEAKPQAALREALDSGRVESLEDEDVLIVALLGQKPIVKTSTLAPWLRSWVQTKELTIQDEIVAELENELNQKKNPCTQIQKAQLSDDPLLNYFLQRLTKLFGCEGTHLGAEIPTPSWRQDLGAPQETLDLLTAATQAKRKGEVILISAILLQNLKKIHPEVMIKVLLALKAIGYDEVADALALELLKAREGQ